MANGDEGGRRLGWLVSLPQLGHRSASTEALMAALPTKDDWHEQYAFIFPQ